MPNNYWPDTAKLGDPRCLTCTGEKHDINSEMCGNCTHRQSKKDAVPVMDLDKITWDGIKKAASESKWIPSEYTMKDWAYDVREYLTNGHPGVSIAAGIRA